MSNKASKWDEKQVASLKLKRDSLQTKIHSLQISTLTSEIHDLSSDMVYLKNRIEFAEKESVNYVILFRTVYNCFF